MRLFPGLFYLLTSVLYAESISYFSDPEGMWDKFEDFLSHNENFYLHDGEYRLKPGAYFVFGGDTCDRGPATQRILRTLKRLYDDNRERVIMIVGNRDGNKVRLPGELSKEAIGSDPKVRVEKLKHILAKTMAAPGAFEFRREEIEEYWGLKKGTVSDEGVVNSYLEDLKEDGLMAWYLRTSKLIHRIGNTLFTHSAITETNYGYVPRQPPIEGLNDWIAKANLWYQDVIQRWEKNPYDRSHFQDLIDYMYYPPQYGLRYHPLSLIYNRTHDRFNNPHLPSPEFIEKLRAQGIRRIVVGHTPSGQTPLVIRYEDFEIIFADNSYAPNEHYAHQIVIKGKELDTVDISFTPHNLMGRFQKQYYILKLGQGEWVGKRLANHSLIALPWDDQFLTFRWEPGFKATYEVKTREQLNLLGAVYPFQVNGPLVSCGESLSSQSVQAVYVQ